MDDFIGKIKQVSAEVTAAQEIYAKAKAKYMTAIGEVSVAKMQAEEITRQPLDNLYRAKTALIQAKAELAKKTSASSALLEEYRQRPTPPTETSIAKVDFGDLS